MVQKPYQPIDSPIRTGENARTPKREGKRDRAIYVLWLMAPLVYATIGWSLLGEHFVDARTQQIVEVAGIALTGTAGLLLALFVRHHNATIERTYSSHLEELTQRLRSLAYTDTLTDLYNHRYFHEQLAHEIERSKRYGRPVSMILLDLDHFKEVNDTYGHVMGDKVLALVGKIISHQVRDSDIAARYGGDEFAIILPDTSRDDAEITAQKLARAVAAGRAQAGALTQSLPLSTSYGVATCPDDVRGVTELVQMADERLYIAKAANRIPVKQFPERETDQDRQQPA